MGDAQTEPRAETVDYPTFRDRQSAPDVAIVDVMPRSTFRHSHIPGAKNLPLAHVLDLAADVLPDKQQEIITYCAGFT